VSAIGAFVALAKKWLDHYWGLLGEPLAILLRGAQKILGTLSAIGLPRLLAHPD
jgi:hypothetical protein